MRVGRPARWLAGLVALLVVFVPVRPAASAAGGASFRGRVVAAGGGAPRAGVVVALVSPSSAEAIYRSSPTDDRGVFRVEGVPAGSYRLLVETPDGAFLASDPLELKAGSNRPVSLALRANSPAEEGASGQNQSRWQKWVIVGGIVVGALIVVDALTEENRASPFF